MLLETLLLNQMGVKPQGTGSPGGANAWDNMAPAEKDFGGDFGDARDLYAAAFNRAALWDGTAKAAYVNPATLGRADLMPRSYQDEHSARLAAIANGSAMGAADPAARASLASGALANQAYAVTKGGANPAATMRALQNTNTATAAGAEAKIAQLKAQEMRAADASLVSNLAATRAGDAAAASEEARLKAQASLANAGFRTQTGIANDEAELRRQQIAQQAFGGVSDHDRQQWANRMAVEKRKRGDADWYDDLAYDKSKRDNAAYGQMANTVGSTFNYGVKAGGGATSSDRDRKRDVKSLDARDVRSLLEAITNGGH